MKIEKNHLDRWHGNESQRAIKSFVKENSTSSLLRASTFHISQQQWKDEEFDIGFTLSSIWTNLFFGGTFSN
jgi:hypothetical protein